MIDYLIGTLESKSLDSVTVEVSGTGYKIYVPASTFAKLGHSGGEVKLYIVEAVSGMYGGVINLYGFMTREERDMYLLIKDEVPSTGAKKALEYMDKISKSFADFKSAVINKNASMLGGIFGFTKKTSEKLIAALKDKIAVVEVSGEEKWQSVQDFTGNSVVAQAIAGLVALGYKESQARTAVNEVYSSDEVTLENLIKKALSVYRE